MQLPRTDIYEVQLQATNVLHSHDVQALNHKVLLEGQGGSIFLFDQSPSDTRFCREERSRHQQGMRIIRLQEQEQDLHAEAASWKLLAALHGHQDLMYPGGPAGASLQGCGKAMLTKQMAASLIGSDLELNR